MWMNDEQVTSGVIGHGWMMEGGREVQGCVDMGVDGDDGWRTAEPRTAHRKPHSMMWQVWEVKALQDA